MTLIFPLLDEPITFDENRIQVLIIENPPALRRVIDELSAQSEGEPGEAVLAVDYVPCDFSKTAVLVTDPFHIDTASKRLLGKIQQAVVWAAEDHADTIHELLERINDLAASISLELDFNAAFDPLVNPEGLVRLLGFHMDNEGLSFPELLLEWMRIQWKLMGKRFLFFMD